MILRTLAAAALSMALIPLAHGQETPQPVTKDAPRVVSNPARDEGTPFNVDFKGGTVAEYVDAVRKAAGDQPVNATFSGGADNLKMAAVSLRNVSLRSAINAIEVSALVSNPQFDRIVITPLDGSQGRNGAILYGVRLLVSSPPGSIAATTRVTEVLSLNEICGAPWLKGKSDVPTVPVETVLTAMEQAMTAGPADPTPPDVRYHKDSGLLILSCTSTQRDAAKQVLQNITVDLHNLRGSRAPAWTTEKFEVQVPQRVFEALRTVFPTDPAKRENEQAVQISGDNEKDKHTLTVHAREDTMIAVRAIVRLADRDASASPELQDMRARYDQAKMEVDAVRHNMELAQKRAEMDVAEAKSRVADLQRHADLLQTRVAEAEARAKAAEAQLQPASSQPKPK